MAVIALTSVVSTCVSISHMSNDHAMQHHRANSAVHRAMKDFAITKPKKKKASKRRQEEEVNVDDVLANKKDIEQEEEKEPQDTANKEQQQRDPSLSTLSCKAHGGPADEHAQEMVYWQDIPTDSHYVSPFKGKQGQHKRYLTFEPDGGGWNNIRYVRCL